MHGKAWTNRDGEQDVLKVMIRRVDVEGASVGMRADWWLPSNRGGPSALACLQDPAVFICVSEAHWMTRFIRQILANNTGQ